jgi:3-hydroxyisobutyrate dehydrogenase-like beta-hydroxyacid dehydrogenase
MRTTKSIDGQVSVIGLGAMGIALAEAFLKDGYKTTVWNRSSEKANGLIKQGAIRASNLSEAVSASPAIIVCVLNYQVVQDLLYPLGSMLSGKVLINLTNGTPGEARELAAWAAEQRAMYLDGGIMAVPPMIGKPESLVLYSGSQDAFQMQQQLLSSLGTSKYLGQDSGMASLYDLSLLSSMYGMFAGFLQAAALVGSAQVKASEFTPLIIDWVAAMLHTLPDLARQIDSGNYRDKVVSNLGMQSVAFVNILRASQEQGIGTDLMVPLKILMDKGVEMGHSADDISSLIRLVRNPSI